MCQCESNLQFRIAPDILVRIAFVGSPNQEAIDKFIAHLELMRDTFVEG